MMKKIYRLVAIVLSITTLFLTACSDKGEGQLQTSQQTEGQLFNDCLHDYEVSVTSDFMVKNGVSDYRIVIESGSGYIWRLAQEEMQDLFKEATGVTLPIILDDNVDLTDGTKNIIVGSKKLFGQANISLSENQLEKNGFVIKTVDKNIFIGGATVDGTLFGVYGFFKTQFNFDCFSHDYYHIDKVDGDVPLYSFNVVDVPDFMLRENGFDYIGSASDTRVIYRMGYTHRTRNSHVSVGSPSGHTTYVYLPPEVYNDASKPETYHPDWYSNANTGYTVGQLCYTAHGNEEEFELMLQASLEAAKKEFMKDEFKDAFIFHWMTEDHAMMCACEACNRELIKYGTPSAVYIKYCNKLADKISEWMETEEGKPYARKFYVKMQAYQKTVPAPAKLNTATGEYEPIDSSVVCNDRVIVEYSPGNYEYQKTMFDKVNEPYYNVFRAWQACCSTISVYSYTVNYLYSLYPYDTFNSQQTFYQFLAANGVIYMFDLGQYGNYGGTGWIMLKNYLCSKLAWDVNADVDYYTDKFFEYYYGEGEEAMREFYDDYRLHSKYMLDHGGLSMQNSIYGEFQDKDIWTKGPLNRWLESIDQALLDIEEVKYYNNSRYNLLYDHITSERVMVLTLLITFYPEDYSATDLLNMKLTVKEDCDRLGIKTSAEGTSISSLWTEWGIA